MYKFKHCNPLPVREGKNDYENMSLDSRGRFPIATIFIHRREGASESIRFQRKIMDRRPDSDMTDYIVDSLRTEGRPWLVDIVDAGRSID